MRGRDSLVKRGPRSGPAARSGPSGPSISRAQRKRRGVEITLSREAIATLDRLVADNPGESRSSLIEAAIAGRAIERYVTPGLVEEAAGVAAATGQTLEDVLSDAIEGGLSQMRGA